MFSEENSANSYASLIALYAYYWKECILHNGLIAQAYLIYLQ